MSSKPAQAETNASDNIYTANEPVPNTASGILSNGLWHLLHDAAAMAHLIQLVSIDVKAWQGVTAYADLVGKAVEPRHYKDKQDAVVARLETFADKTPLWHLQYITLMLVWMLPNLKAELEKASPQTVCVNFFDSFDDLMGTLVFGNSKGDAHAAKLPVGIVAHVTRELRLTYG